MQLSNLQPEWDDIPWGMIASPMLFSHPSIGHTSVKLLWFCVSNFAHVQPHLYPPPIGHAHLSCDPIFTQKIGIAVYPHHTEHK